MNDKLFGTIVGIVIVTCILFLPIGVHADPIVTQATSDSTVTNTTNTTTRIKTNPPSAICLVLIVAIVTYVQLEYQEQCRHRYLVSVLVRRIEMLIVRDLR